MMRVICFGEALIDFLAQPWPDKRLPRLFAQHAGGAPANVSVAVARLGGHSCFSGMIGVDMFGDYLVDELRRYGVVTDFVVRTQAAKTALAFVQLDAEGERSFNFYRPPAADLLFRRTDFQDAMFADAKIFHVCSNSFTESDIAETTVFGMKKARDNGLLVSMDLNWRPMLWAREIDPFPRLWEALLLADIVKVSMEELRFLAQGSAGSHADTDVIQRLLKGHSQLVIVTNGGRPISWYTRAEQGKRASFPVHVHDTTAAGDAFVGAVLYRLAQHTESAELTELIADKNEVENLVRFGAAAGALTVTRAGSFTAMPSLVDVETLLRKHDES